LVDRRSVLGIALGFQFVEQADDSGSSVGELGNDNIPTSSRSTPK